jgi:hypothetical protein
MGKSNQFGTPTTETLLAHIIARDVAYGVEMARSIGHRMPVEYDVGFSGRMEQPLSTGIATRIRLRLDDAIYEVPVIVPYLDGRTTIQQVDRLWRALMDRLKSASLSLAHVWLDKHPDAMSKDAEASLERLQAISRDDAAETAWAEECRNKAQAARFQMVR